MTHQPDSLCPYCKERDRNSRDHIFPEFLGGTRTIGACKECNDVFGHSSEGPVCKDLAPFAVLLRKSRIEAPRYAIWRKALVHENIEWDLDTDLIMRPSRPQFDKGADVARAVFPNEGGAKKWAEHVQETGKQVRLESRTGPSIQMKTTSFNFTIGTELRRVSAKMCVAVADYLGIKHEILDALGRNFPLGRADSGDRARIDWRIHPALEALRSPLSHLIFVKGNSRTHRCYGVSQFYGAFQVQLILKETNYSGDDFACFGRLDPVLGYKETFEMTDLLLVPEAPVRLDSGVADALQQEWITKLTKECKTAFGEEAVSVTMRSDLSNS